MAFLKFEPRFPFAAVLAAALCAGCSGSSNGAADATADYEASLPNEDGGSSADASDATTTPGVAIVRMVHVSPDLGPVDFCWRTAGSATYAGPVLSRGMATAPVDAGGLSDGPSASEAGDATSVSDARSDAREDSGGREDAAEASAAVDAGAKVLDATADAEEADDAAPTSAPGLSFGEITSNVQLDAAGTFDIALVDAGAASCLTPKLVAQVTLDAGKHATMALVGLLSALDSDADAAQALTIVAFTDDEDLDLLNARVRLIHAALGATSTAEADAARQIEAAAPALSVDVGNVEVAAEIDPKQASTASGAPPVDALGYSTVSPVSSSTAMGFQGLGDAGGDVWSTGAEDFDLLGGTLHTGFIVSRLQGSLAIVWCSDAATAVSTQPSPCQLFEAPRIPKF